MKTRWIVGLLLSIIGLSVYIYVYGVPFLSEDDDEVTTKTTNPEPPSKKSNVNPNVKKPESKSTSSTTKTKTTSNKTTPFVPSFLTMPEPVSEPNFFSQKEIPFSYDVPYWDLDTTALYGSSFKQHDQTSTDACQDLCSKDKACRGYTVNTGGKGTCWTLNDIQDVKVGTKYVRSFVKENLWNSKIKYNVVIDDSEPIHTSPHYYSADGSMTQAVKNAEAYAKSRNIEYTMLSVTYSSQYHAWKYRFYNTTNFNLVNQKFGAVKFKE